MKVFSKEEYLADNDVDMESKMWSISAGWLDIANGLTEEEMGENCLVTHPDWMVDISPVYNVMYGIGRVKYVVNTHDGTSTHPDGSPVYGINTFSNKKKMKAYIKSLKKKGYVEEN